MTVVNPKSISGINSITMASGSDDLLTIHSNNTTERVRINNSGDVIVGSGVTLSVDGHSFHTGVVTATSFSGDGSALTGIAATDNVRTGILDVAGVGTFRGDVNIPDKIIHLGDTNTAIRFPDADTITAETAGSERVRITSTGLFGIGITPTAKLHVNGVTGTDIIAARSADSNGNSVINIISEGTTGNSKLNFSDTAGIDGQISYFHNARALTFAAGGTTEQLRITSAGKLGVGVASPVSILHLHEAGSDGAPIIQFSNGDTGTTTGDGFAIGMADNESPFIYNRENTDLRIATNNTERVRILSGGGITFNGDTATANALDDYEEGTFTPDWRGSQALGTTSYGTYNAGSYVKIGNQVSVRGFSEITGTSGGSGTWFLHNMPFTVGGGDDRRYRSVGSVMIENFNLVSDVIDVVGYLERNTNDMHLRTSRDNGGSGDINTGNDTSFEIYWTITYQTA